jgi:hypothetical protein
VYSSENIIRTMKWAGHVASTGKSGMHTAFWWERQKEDRHRREDNINITLEKQDRVLWTGLI